MTKLLFLVLVISVMAMACGKETVQVSLDDLQDIAISNPQAGDKIVELANGDYAVVTGNVTEYAEWVYPSYPSGETRDFVDAAEWVVRVDQVRFYTNTKPTHVQVKSSGMSDGCIEVSEAIKQVDHGMSGYRYWNVDAIVICGSYQVYRADAVRMAW